MASAICSREKFSEIAVFGGNTELLTTYLFPREAMIPAKRSSTEKLDAVLGDSTIMKMDSYGPLDLASGLIQELTIRWLGPQADITRDINSRIRNFAFILFSFRPL
jgi:hypothetical protein